MPMPTKLALFLLLPAALVAADKVQNLFGE